MKFDFFEAFLAREKRLKAQARYRFDPVIRTGGGGRYHKYWRLPRTVQEMRYFHRTAEDLDHGWKVRARRGPCHLPDSWWDLDHSRRGNRNWKHFRKHQWKEKTGG